ncbi:MAG: hypothetical protein FWC94_00365 [Bacteroidales bacterium]|nr:hypothetical protein [Bacteroidales bacterium]
MENPFNTEQNKPKRSTLLTVFLVLTFIGSGLSLLSNGTFALLFSHMIDLMHDLADSETWGAVFNDASIAQAEKLGVLGYALPAILYLFSLIGAVLMWKLNKRGFHLYATAQIIILFVPMMVGTGNFPGIFPTLLTALFIFVYARELKIFEKPIEE